MLKGGLLCAHRHPTPNHPAPVVVWIGNGQRGRQMDSAPSSSRRFQRSVVRVVSRKESGYSGWRRRFEITPTMPSRKRSTQATKITPWTTSTQEPRWAR
jgi:hypothetical protein